NISSDGQSPTIEPSKFFAYDFKGKFARFEFGDVSASIDNDRSIFRLVDHATQSAPGSKKTVNACSTSITVDKTSAVARSRTHRKSPETRGYGLADRGVDQFGKSGWQLVGQSFHDTVRGRCDFLD